MEACQVSFQRSHLFVKIPEVDILYMKPMKMRLEEDGTLTVSSRFSSIGLRFRDKGDCQSLCEEIRSTMLPKRDSEHDFQELESVTRI